MVYMEYKEFLEKMEEILCEMLSEKKPVIVKFVDFLRNNNVIKQELQIYTPGEPYGKVLDCKPLFERHLQGTEIEQLAQEVMEIYLQEEPKELAHIWQELKNYEGVKDRIFVRVINYEDNRTFLSLCPHIKKLDLALTFRLKIQDANQGLLSMTIDNNICKQWGITSERLYEDAIKNAEDKFPPVILPIHILVKGEFAENQLPEALAEADDDLLEGRMYAITNAQSLNGATAVFYPGLLKKLADKMQSDIYLMPSSIHEMMAVPCENWDDVSQLKSIVEDANQTVVSAEERLGNSVYKYERETDVISIAI